MIGRFLAKILRLMAVPPHAIDPITMAASADVNARTLTAACPFEGPCWLVGCHCQTLAPEDEYEDD